MQRGTIRNFNAGTDLTVFAYNYPRRKSITIQDAAGEANITLDEQQCEQLRKLLIFEEK